MAEAGNDEASDPATAAADAAAALHPYRGRFESHDRFPPVGRDRSEILDEMPLNPTGKIDRVGLKRMAEDHLHPHGLG